MPYTSADAEHQKPANLVASDAAFSAGCLAFAVYALAERVGGPLWPAVVALFAFVSVKLAGRARRGARQLVPGAVRSPGAVGLVVVLSLLMCAVFCAGLTWCLDALGRLI